MERPVASYGGITFLQLLTIVFVACKLTGVISWSWWWVLAPLWAPVALVIAVVFILGIIGAIVGGK
jgi:hypothetical protein